MKENYNPINYANKREYSKIDFHNVIKYTPIMVISQNKFEILFDGIFFGRGRAANAYMPVSGLLAIGALAFLLLTHGPVAVDHGAPAAVRSATADIDLAPAGGNDGGEPGWSPASRHAPKAKPLIKPTQILVRGAFQGAY